MLLPMAHRRNARQRLSHDTFLALHRRWSKYCVTGDFRHLIRGVRTVGFALRNQPGFRSTMESSKSIQHIADEWMGAVKDFSTTAGVVRTFYGGNASAISAKEALAYAFRKYYDRMCGWRYLILQELVRRSKSERLTA